MKTFLKSIKGYLYSILYGPIKGIIAAQKNKNIELKKIFFHKKVFYNIYIINFGSVISNSVDDTAYLYDNYLIKEPSYQYRINKKNLVSNGKINSNFILNYGIQYLKKNLNLNLISLLSGGASKTNYWHWMFDTLPKIGILERSKINITKSFFLSPSLSQKFQLETLLSLGLSKKQILNGEKFKHIKARQVIATDHPINLNNNPTNSITNIPSWIIKWHRKKYIKKFNKSFFYKKIFIDRNTKNRRIINNNEFKKILLENGFKIIKLENYSFFNQVKLFNRAKIIAGIHGAGFANIIFCKKNTKIIELSTKSSGDAIKNLAKKCNLKYFRILNNNISNSLKYQNFHINVNVLKLKNNLKKFKAG